LLLSSLGKFSTIPTSSKIVANLSITNCPLSGLPFCLPLNCIKHFTLSPPVKNLAFFKELDKITFELTYKESPDDNDLLIVRTIQVSSGKFKVNWMSGETSIIRDITKQALSQRLDVKNKKWDFKISNNDFLDIKKLSNINSERIINMDVSNGVVTLSEKSAWQLEVDDLNDSRNSNLILNKRFLSCINDKMEYIKFYIFDNFMLVNDNNSSLMLSMEQDLEDHE